MGRCQSISLVIPSRQDWHGGAVMSDYINAELSTWLEDLRNDFIDTTPSLY